MNHFKLEFRTAAQLASIREYCAELVRVVHPSAAGQWQLTKSVPRPHEGHGSNDVLAHTTWQLGEATLVQRVDGGDGNPRDGYGFDLSFECSFVGPELVARTIKLSNSSYEAHPSSLLFELGGFTPAEFFAARAVGVERFGHDHTGHPTWARYNIDTFVKCGEREGARQLAREALTKTGPAFTAYARRLVQRTLCELTDEPEARRIEESRALLGNPTDVERLAAVADGSSTLPDWTQAQATAVLQHMSPWTDSSNPALAHRWWPAASSHAMGGWRVLQSQPHSSKRVDGRFQIFPEGSPRPIAHVDAVHAMVLQLGIQEQVSIAALQPEVEQGREGVILSLTPQVKVRGMVHRRIGAEPECLLWTWFFTGEGHEGAIVVSRSPFDPRVPAAETHVLFIGNREAQEAKLVENGRLVLTPVAS